MKDFTRNVFVGISLSNKSFSQAAVSQIRALRIAYLIADEIDLINMRLFDKGTELSLRGRLSEKVREIEEVVVQGTTPPMKEVVQIFRWKHILNARYWRLYYRLNSLFIYDARFREDVVKIAQLYAERRHRQLSESQMLYLSGYILAELPTLIEGIEIRGKKYRGMIYPSYQHESMITILNCFRERVYEDDLGELMSARVHQFEI